MKGYNTSEGYMGLVNGRYGVSEYLDAPQPFASNLQAMAVASDASAEDNG